MVQPDVTGINKSALIKFYNYAKKINDKFSVMGPHFLDAPKKGHYQTSLTHKIMKIHNVHGSTIFLIRKFLIRIKDLMKIYFYIGRKLIIQNEL